MAELPNPVNFEAATAHVREEDVAEMIPCGPDLDRHAEAIRQWTDAGFDHVAVVQVGDPERFFQIVGQRAAPPTSGLIVAQHGHDRCRVEVAVTSRGHTVGQGPDVREVHLVFLAGGPCAPPQAPQDDDQLTGLDEVIRVGPQSLDVIPEDGRVCLQAVPAASARAAPRSSNWARGPAGAHVPPVPVICPEPEVAGAAE